MKNKNQPKKLHAGEVKIKISSEGLEAAANYFGVCIMQLSTFARLNKKFQGWRVFGTDDEMKAGAVKTGICIPSVAEVSTDLQTMNISEASFLYGVTYRELYHFINKNSITVNKDLPRCKRGTYTVKPKKEKHPGGRPVSINYPNKLAMVNKLKYKSLRQISIDLNIPYSSLQRYVKGLNITVGTLTLKYEKRV